MFYTKIGFYKNILKNHLRPFRVNYTSSRMISRKNLFFFTESKCDSASLHVVNDSIQSNITQLESYLQTIATSKINLRKQIDCTNSVVKGTIFERYQEMCTRKVIIQNTLDDLSVKLNIIKKELERCQNRSEFILIILKHKTQYILTGESSLNNIKATNLFSLNNTFVVIKLFQRRSNNAIHLNSISINLVSDIEMK